MRVHLRRRPGDATAPVYVHEMVRSLLRVTVSYFWDHNSAFLGGFCTKASPGVVHLCPEARFLAAERRTTDADATL